LAWKSKAYWAAVGLILPTGAYTGILKRTSVPPGRTPDLSRIPLVVGSWRGEQQLLADWEYRILQVDQSLNVRYVHPSGEVMWLFIGYFRNQKYGAQIHSPKNCLPGGGWKILAQKRFRLKPPDSPFDPVPLTYLLISNGREEQVMLYWFETRKGKIANEFYLKFDLLVNSLLYRPTAAAFVRFNMPVTNGETQQTLETLQQFIVQLLPSIESTLTF